MNDFDYLSAEEAIIERLTAAVPEFAEVRGEGSLATMKEGALRSPSALIVYAGDDLGDPAGSTSLITQLWIVVIAVKKPGDRTGSGARDKAGALITKTLAALQGFEPGERFTALKRVNGPRPELLPGGTLFIPLTFETQLAV